MQLVILVSLTLLFSNISNAASTTHVFSVSSHIDKNSFFSNSITLMRFFPEVMTLRYNNDAQTFYSQTSNLYIETDIPESEALSNYSLVLTRNDSICINRSSDNAGPENIAHVSIDDNPLGINDSLLVNGFNQTKEGFKAANHLIKLDFEPLAVPDSVLKCEGNVSFRMDFNI